VLIHLTGDAREIVDRMLPTVLAAATDALAHVTEADREQLMAL
jgi:hypothetical protein